MADLIKVPHFRYEQGDVFAGEGNPEYPLDVLYYRDCIAVEQNGNTINIRYEDLKKFFKEIQKHEAEGKKHWK